tara:strand:- start:15214 stop:17286 length:2073 start_codon:yes stop_codon:yes gene_type:complete
MKFKFFLLCFSLWFISCKPDPKTANWDVGVLSPVLNSRIDIQDIIEDSLLSTNSDNQLSLIYRNRIAQLNFNRINEGFNKSFENTVKLQSIDLGTRVVNNSLSLGRLAGSAGIAGAIIIINNGNTSAIPAFTGIGPETFDLDASDFFESMTLTDGWLVIEIDNGLPIELTNVQYLMQNQSGGTPIISRTVNSILPGELYKDSVQLNNNITIEGQISAILQNMDTPGSNGNPVLIDTSDAIHIKVSIKDLEPSSATAIFPDQVLLEDTTDTEIEDFNGELTSMHVGRGKMFLDAKSTIEDEIIFVYSIPSAVENGISLIFTEKVPPAPVGGFSTSYAEKDITGYDVDLTGQPGSSGIFNTFYTITDGRIDSSGNLINLSLTDSVFLNTGIIDLVAARGYGYLGLDTIMTTEDSEIDLFEGLDVEEIDFDEVKLSVEIYNYIGAPINAVVNSIQSTQNQSNAKLLIWNQLNQSLTIPPATENTPGLKPNPGYLKLDLNKSNSNIDEVLETQPDLISSNLDAFLNQSLTVPNYNQFIYLDYGIDAYISAEIPLYLSAKNMLLSDTSEFVYSNLDPSNRLQSGDLILNGDNYFPFDIGLEIILLDSNKTAIDTLNTTEFIKSGNIDNNGTVNQSVKTSAHYAIDPQAVERLKIAEFMVFRASFSTSNLPGKVRFYADSHLDIILSADLTLRTGS